MRKVICVLILFLMLLTFIPHVSASDDPCVASFTETEFKDLEVGDVFTVELFVELNQLADTIAFGDMSYRGLVWDGDVLDCVGYRQGDIFDTAIFWFNESDIVINNDEGYTDEMVWGGPSDGSENDGVFAEIDFEVVGTGNTYITIGFFGVARSGEDLSKTVSSTAGSVLVSTVGGDDDNGGGNGGSGGNGGGGDPPYIPPSDSDGDGVPDNEDICPGFDDNVDTDGDGIPDGCDMTPYGYPPVIKSDSGNISHVYNESTSNELLLWAETSDDTVKAQVSVNSSQFEEMTYNSTTNRWEYIYPVYQNNTSWQYIITIFDEYNLTDSVSRTLVVSSNDSDETPFYDSDGDGVPDDEDICPGFDDNVDTDGDGIPDGCDQNPNGTTNEDNDDDIGNSESSDSDEEEDFPVMLLLSICIILSLIVFLILHMIFGRKDAEEEEKTEDEKIDEDIRKHLEEDEEE